MLVELTVTWGFATTPPSPYPMRVYWREKGSTLAYATTDVADGLSTTITLINDSYETLTTPCSLEYEGWVIPLCFIGTATDCNPLMPDLVTDNPDCLVSNREYWNATVNALNYQSCRGVTVTCVKSGVMSIHALDPDLMFQQTYLTAGFPFVDVTLPGSGSGFDATCNSYNSITGFITDDCWIIDQGNNYSAAPVVKLVPSDTGVEIEMVVTMACNGFEYQLCGAADTGSGEILLGESTVVCMSDDNYPGFDPIADNSVFEHSKTGCCSGNGHSYTLTFANPDSANYSNVKVGFAVANSTNPGERFNITLVDGIPRTTPCIVEGSLGAEAVFPWLVCETDPETNTWLFENYVLPNIVDNGPC